MKSYGVAMVLMLAMVVTSLALDVAEIEGRWVAETSSIEFLGSGIGRDDGGYFKYSLVDDQLALDYGAGETTEYTVSLVDGELHLTDAEGDNHTYTPEDLNLTACAINLHKLNAAKQLYAKDHGDSYPSIRDLVPAYLPDLPECPEGGMYVLHPPGVNPQCTIAEHGIED